ncbi:unnamed protein product [Angiostrongylus costaricensis]|uniref:GATOR2 complex protein WDR24 n=1 Tax=Angiostrongylus costaricensis TaxID=334426 RepID=A0A158PEW2_ANGCS|nr:unnamed protein product [Angiostrongylus costaricensis]
MAEIPPIELPNVRKRSNEMYLQDYDLDDDLIVASPSSSKSIVDICDPVDAISANREETRLVVAGCLLRVFQFAEDGFRQLVDLRPLIQFPAHQGYAASIALNPRERHLIASGGGRDKFIKVWNCSSSRPSAPTYQVETMAPVGRVYWSPDPTNVFHIASCAGRLILYSQSCQRYECAHMGYQTSVLTVCELREPQRQCYRYLAGGRPLRTLCNHNANLAAQLGQASVAQSWRFMIMMLLKLLQPMKRNTGWDFVFADLRQCCRYKKEMELHGKKVPEPPRSLIVRPTYLTRFVSHCSNLYRLKKGAHLWPSNSLRYSDFVASNIASGDFYFGAGELTKTAVEKGIENPHYNDFTGLKDEAFALKPDLTKLTFMSVSSDDDGHIEKEHIARMNWDPMQEVVRLLRYHADQGDMQTCATVSLVCGRRLSNVMDDFTVESWKESYIAMLDQLDLHTAVAGVKKYSWIKRLNQRSLETERKCAVGECMCACGTNVVQIPRKKTNVTLSQTLRDLIRIELNGFPRGGLTEVTEQEGVKTRQNITLPVERDILKLLESPCGQIEVRNKLCTVLFWLREKKRRVALGETTPFFRCSNSLDSTRCDDDFNTHIAERSNYLGYWAVSNMVLKKVIPP